MFGDLFENIKNLSERFNINEYDTLAADGYAMKDEGPEELPLTVDEMRTLLLAALNSMVSYVNEWSVRDTLKYFTSWGFWKGGEMASLDEDGARDVIIALREYLQTTPQDADIEDAFDKLEYYITDKDWEQLQKKEPVVEPTKIEADEMNQEEDYDY